jgi:isopenicillin-N epimerase
MEKNNWYQVKDNCKSITQFNAIRFCELMKTEPLTAISDDFIVQLFSIPIHIKHPEKLHDLLYDNYKIQIPVLNHEGKFYLRYSIQGFNEQSDLDRLFNVLNDLRPEIS